MTKNIFSTLVIAFSLFALTSCDRAGNNTPDPQPLTKVHFDIWTPLEAPSVMTTRNYLVGRATSLDFGVMDFEGKGADLSDKLNPETFMRGRYYYQISKDGRFGKYRIHGDRLEVLSEFPFTTFRQGKFAHAWIDDRTVVLMGTTATPYDKVLWSKIDVEQMKEVAHGTLNLKTTPPNARVGYSSAGMLAYRTSDNMLMYFFNINENKGKRLDATPEFYLAFVDAKTMRVEKEVSENRASMMGSTSYGELRQNKSFFDEKGDYYIVCNSLLKGELNGQGKVITTAMNSALLRVKNGTLDFDRSYNAYDHPRGKILTVNYLNNGKALLYMQDPKVATPDNPVWDSKTNPYVYYWEIVDLRTMEVTRLRDIPYGNGNFSQLAVVSGQKAYLANNAKDESAVYIYDIATGKISKGMTLAKGFTFERIVPMVD